MRRSIGWAGRAYEQGVGELKEVAEGILRRDLEEDMVLRWPEGSGQRMQHVGVVQPAEATEGGVYTDGSMIGGQTAATTITMATCWNWIIRRRSDPGIVKEGQA